MRHVIGFTVVSLLVGVALLSACGGRHASVLQPDPAGSAVAGEVGQLDKPAGVDAALWRELKTELTRVLAAVDAEHAVSAAPSDALSKVPDLVVGPGAGGAAEFTFSYRCTGDYDQNGEVNIADLTPVGVNFGKTISSPGWDSAQVADGDDNGEINIADLTPIGQHFATRVTGYELQMASSSDPGGSWSALADIPLTDGAIPGGGGFRHFDYALDSPTSDMYYRVVPYEEGTPRLLGIPSDAVFFSINMLAAPANVAASDGTYNDRITVTWDKVTGATQYMVYRDSQSTPLATLGDVNSYDDMALIDTAVHTYWLKASDGTRVSNFSVSDAGFMGSVQPGLQPPTNVHASKGGYEDHILIDWTKSANAMGYQIYRDSQSAPIDSVADIAMYNDYGVTDVFQHTYWVKATDAIDESDFSMSDTGFRAAPATGTMVVLAWNDLGMHCMNQDFSEMMILPPYNVLHAQVISRVSGDPQIVTEGVTVRYTIPENTHSADKCNFWDFAHALLNVNLAPNIGLTGNGLAGTMSPLIVTEGRNDWSVTGIPITPINDAGIEDPYSLATVTVESGGDTTARTQAVVPVSWEISCQICHTTAGITVAEDILTKHDALHSTNLMNARPVMCGGCHAQPPLGTAGLPGLPTLSSAMHSSHATRMAAAGLEVECYACHPGVRTQCLRDVMFSAGLTCHDCHGTMADVGSSLRSPWADEPRCDQCHHVAGHEYEQPGTLYRNSVGHNGVHCAACHGSPHAITPTVVAADNVQAIKLQGHSGKIDTCTVCHTTPPGDPFNHTAGEGGG